MRASRQVGVPARTGEKAIANEPEEPPVVARLVVEVRSDGSRTIARGAMEDAATGERVAIEAKGATPIQLATSLTKSMFSMPMLARHAVRALIESRRRGK